MIQYVTTLIMYECKRILFHVMPYHDGSHYDQHFGVVGICVSALPCMLHHTYLASYSTSSLVES